MDLRQPESLVFALDVGTRNVAGILARQQNGGLKVEAVAVCEHKTRAMLDGQVHDVEKAAQAVREVKKALESNLEYALDRASVAVAGRSLMTSSGESRLAIGEPREIVRDDVLTLMVAAIQDAQRKFISDETDAARDLYCVGYSPVEYRLDDAPLKNLLGQMGDVIQARVIATFLPRVVVDSMYAVLDRCDLKAASVTLEPIAAMDLVIPDDMRRLNLALLDVGAGTSDVAVSRDGTISGYGMVPMAGDEVSERLCDRYLVDFAEAERIKRLLPGRDMVTFKDVLGVEQTVSASEIIAELGPTVDALASRISDLLFKLNGKPPEAVMMIGGGSLTPQLKERLCHYLGLGPQRVAVRDLDAIRDKVSVVGELPGGPEMVTPVGIAMTAIHNRGFKFIKIYVNNRLTRVLALKPGLAVKEAIVAAGLDIDSVRGAIGRSISLDINGKVQVFRGKLGRPPAVSVNSAEADLTTPIADGDVIEIVRGERGIDAVVRVEDLVPQSSTRRVWINGNKVDLEPLIFVNGERAGYDAVLDDRARVVIKTADTLGDALSYCELLPPHPVERRFTLISGDERRDVARPLAHMTINNRPASLDEPIRDDDRIEFSVRERRELLVRDVLAELEDEVDEIIVLVNDRPVKVKRFGRIMVNGREAFLDTPVAQGDEVFYEKGMRQPIMSDVLKDIPELAGDDKPAGKVQIFINDQPSGFTTPISHGDKIRLTFG